MKFLVELKKIATGSFIFLHEAYAKEGTLT